VPPHSQVLPHLHDGDVVSFVYRAADGSVSAFVNGCRAAAFAVRRSAWVYPMAQLFGGGGFSRLRLVRYEALLQHRVAAAPSAAASPSASAAGRAGPESFAV